MTAPSKDEYLKASRALATGFGGTLDFADKSVGTTAQSAEGVGASNEGLPGQVFSVDQLPDPAVAVAYGMPPVRVPDHLILDTPADAEHHIQGKTTMDIANAELRRELGDPTLAMDNEVVSAAESVKAFADRQSASGKMAAAAVQAEDEKDGDTDQTGSGRPVDPEGVQRSDGGGTPNATTANSGSGQGQDDKGTVGGKAR